MLETLDEEDRLNMDEQCSHSILPENVAEWETFKERNE